VKHVKYFVAFAWTVRGQFYDWAVLPRVAVRQIHLTRGSATTSEHAAMMLREFAQKNSVLSNLSRSMVSDGVTGMDKRTITLNEINAGIANLGISIEKIGKLYVVRGDKDKILVVEAWNENSGAIAACDFLKANAPKVYQFKINEAHGNP
jgi:hypothetical protein